MYYHSKKTGVIFPLHLYLMWKFRIPLGLLAFGLFFAGPISAILGPPSLKPTASQKAEQEAKLLQAWHQNLCAHPTQPKDVAFCKSVKRP
jgi:hypothetical protein